MVRISKNNYALYLHSVAFMIVNWCAKLYINTAYIIASQVTTWPAGAHLLCSSKQQKDAT